MRRLHANNSIEVTYSRNDFKITFYSAAAPTKFVFSELKNMTITNVGQRKMNLVSDISGQQF